MVAQLVLGLSILVGIHEFGHMISAKMFGMRVEKFSIGFPPKVIGAKFGETEYSLGAIPLGGFVKITGMIDESLDTENLSAEPEKHEFRAKPAWQRLTVMLGGIIMNVILGILVFIGIAYFYGDPYLSIDEANKYGLYANELGKSIGFQEGDKVLKINGEEFEKFSDISGSDAILSDNGYYDVERNGQIIQLKIPNDFLDKLSDQEEREAFVKPIRPFDIKEVTKGEPADKAGLLPEDKIISMAGQKIEYFHHLRKACIDNKGKKVDFEFVRNGVKTISEVQISDKGTIGIAVEDLLVFDTTTYSFTQSIPVGTTKAFKTITDQMKAFRKIFRGDVSASKSLSGPIGIAKIFGGDWDWLHFWTILGLLSMILAFMNLLPIPALDGGHVIFILYEMISGRKPGDKFLEVAQKVGMVILLGIMVFAIGNDVWKHILKQVF